jgi:hypothetical protein
MSKQSAFAKVAPTNQKPARRPFGNMARKLQRVKGCCPCLKMMTQNQVKRENHLATMSGWRTQRQEVKFKNARICTAREHPNQGNALITADCRREVFYYTKQERKKLKHNKSQHKTT